MGSELFFENKKYISTKNASRKTGYSNDYIGQLCRENKIDSRRVGRSWFVSEDAILNYKNTDQDLNQNGLKNFTQIKSRIYEKSLETKTSIRESETVSKISLWKKTYLPKYKQVVHEVLFYSDFGLPKKLLTLSLALLLSVGSFALADNVQNLGKTVTVAVVEIPGKLAQVSRTISNIPSGLYGATREVTDFYSSRLGTAYTHTGTKLFNTSFGFLNSSLRELSLFGKNPPEYILNNFSRVAVGERKVFDTTGRLAMDSVSNAHEKVFAFLSDASLGFSDIKKTSQNSNFSATVFFAPSQLASISAVDTSGVHVYDTVNSWFEWGVYAPVAKLLNRQPEIVNAVYVAKNNTQKQNETNNIPVAKSNTSVSTSGARVVVQNSNPVVERVVEKTTIKIEGGVSQADLTLALNQLNNKIQSDITAFSARQSSGNGGNITNVYQQIASSQKIDNLYNTTINNPTISGGSISNTGISATSISSSGALVVSGPTSLSDLLINGSTTLQSATSTNFFATNQSFTNLFGTNATSTNFFTTNFTTSGIINFSNIALNSLLSTDASGNVVATSTPTFGNFNATSTVATSTVSSGGFAVNTNKFVVQQNSGNIGIGTTTPHATIDITQNQNGQAILSAYRATDSAPTGDFINYKTQSGTTLFRVDNSGNLLAGGIVNSGSQTITSVSTPQFRVQYDSSNEWTASTIATGSTTFAVNGANSSLNFVPQTNQVNAFTFQAANGTQVLGVDTVNGRVGVSTTTPFASLSVNNVAGQAGFVVGSSTGTTFIVNKQGNVGIGSVVPAAKLDIYSSSPQLLTMTADGTYAQQQFVSYRNSATTHGLFEGLASRGTKASPLPTQSGDALFSIRAGGYGTTDFDSNLKDDAAALEFQADGAFSDTGGNPTHPGRIVFQTALGTGYLAERMRITSAGNVGIGTTGPVSLLTVGSATPTTAASGLNFGTDTSANLYRSAASTIKTDGNLVVAGTSTQTGNVGIGTTATTAARLNVVSSGSVTPLQIESDGNPYAIILKRTDLASGTDVRIWNGSANKLNIENAQVTQNFSQNTDSGITLSNVNSGTTATALLTVTSSAGTANYGVTGSGFTTSSGGTYDTSYLFNVAGSGLSGMNLAAAKSTGVIKFFTGGTSSTNERVRIDSNGNFGIGSTTPGYKLSVAGTGYFDGGSVIASVLTATSSISTPSLTLSSVAVNSLLSTNSSGVIVATSTPTFGNLIATSTTLASTFMYNVGIGTTTPAYRLEVSNQSSQYANVRLVTQGLGYGVPTAVGTVSDGDKILFFNESGAKTGYGAGAGNDLWIQASAQLTNPAFRIYNGAAGISPTQRFTVLGNGNVGIGSTAPTVALDVVGAGVFSSTLNVTGLATFVSASTTNVGSTGSAYFATSGGNVGIGTTAPTAKFQITDSTYNFKLSFATGFQNYTTGATGWANFGTDGTSHIIDFFNGSNIRLGGMDASGNLGIGSLAPTSLLDVAQTAAQTITAANNVAKITKSGAITNNTGYLTNNALTISNTSTSIGSQSVNNVGLNITSSGADGNVGLAINATSGIFIGSSLPNNPVAAALHSTSAVGRQFLFNNSTIGTAATDGTYFSQTTAGEFWFNNQESNGTLQFYIADSEKMRVNSTGFIGIASTTPWGLLSVNPTALGSGVPEFVVGSSTATHLIVNGAGNVGIATTTPWGSLAVNNIAGQPGFVVGSSTATSFIVDKNGNVGVGTSAPGTAMQINVSTTAKKGLVVKSTDDSSSNNTFEVQRADGAANFTVSPAGDINLLQGGTVYIANGIALAKSGAQLQIGTGFTSQYFSGNVGIGSLTPGAKLDVAGFINTDQYSGYKMAGNLFAYASSTNFATILGIGAGGQNATTSATTADTTAVGYKALNALTTGADNTAVGWRALLSDITGRRNTAVGSNALVSSTADQNTAVGMNALVNDTSGEDNTAMGYQALGTITTNSQSAAFGSGALASATGGLNSALGYQALNQNTSGAQNNAQGYRALYSNLGGSNNTAIGVQSAYNNTTAVQTVSLGTNSANGSGGAYTATGYVAIGYGAGIAFATGADYNTLLGFQSGYGITSGSKNINIGAYTTTANANITTGSNNIIIGNDTQAPSATASNQLNIGNFIYGTSLSGTGSTLSTAGNLGIGTTTPYGTFAINSVAGTPSFAIGSSTGSYVLVDKNGNVGIGTTAPLNKLELYHAGGTGVYALFQPASNSTAQIGMSNGVAAFSSSNVMGFYTGATMAADGAAISTATERVRIDSGGNVGIGTTVPNTKLQVTGNAVIGVNADASPYSNGLSVTGNSGSATSMFLWQGGIGSGHIGFRASDPNLYIVNSYADGLITNTNAITLNINGNVGIGTTAPNDKLQVRVTTDQNLKVHGNLSLANGISLLSINDANNTYKGLELNGSLISMQANSAGNVGIGTSAAENRLQVAGAIESTGVRATPAGSAVTLSSESTYDALQSWNSRPLVLNGAGNNVGIGTTAPAAKLTVGSTSSTNYSNNQYEFSTGSDKTTTARGGTLVQSSDSSNPFALYTRIEGSSSDATRAATLQTGVEGTNNSGNILLNPYAGNVGVGATVPQATLQVGSYSDATGEATYHGAIMIADPNAATTLNGSTGLEFKSSPAGSGYGWKIGGAGTSGLDLAFGNRQSSATWTEMMRLQASSGNVGIGTTVIPSLLTIKGASADLRIDTTGAAQDPTLTFARNGTSKWSIYHENSNNTLGLYDRTNSVFRLQVWPGTTQAMTIDAGGNVGIGTTAPLSGSKLDLYQGRFTARQAINAPGVAADFGNIDATDLTSMASGVGGAMTFSGSYTGTTQTTLARIGGTKENGTDANFGGQLDFYTRANGSATWGASRLHIASDGNVGVGTTSAGANLTVKQSNDSQNTAGLKLIASGSANDFSLFEGSDGNSYLWNGASGGGMEFYTNNGTNAMFIKSDGNVGIGTTAPLGKIDVYNASTAQAIRVSGPGSVSLHELGRIAFGVTGLVDGASIRGGSDDYGATYSAGELQFWTGDAVSAALQRMTILKGGNVGIGSISPGYKLDVVGTSHVTSTATFDGSLSLPTLTVSSDTTSWGATAVLKLASGTNATGLSMYTGSGSGYNWSFIPNQIAFGDFYISRSSAAGTSNLPNTKIFGWDNTTLFLRPIANAANSVQVQNSAGTSVLDVDTTNGYVGIGTTVPSTGLSIVGTSVYNGNGNRGLIYISDAATTGSGIEINSSATGGTRWTLVDTAAAHPLGGGVFAINDTTNSTYPFQIVASGSASNTIVLKSGGVGIAGTPSGYGRLEISGGGTGNAQTAANILINETNVRAWQIGAGYAVSGNLTFHNVGSGLNPLTISSGDNVGIGTTAPNDKLTISGSERIFGNTSTNGVSTPAIASFGLNSGAYLYGPTNTPTWSVNTGSYTNNNATAPDNNTTAGTYTFTATSYDMYQTISVTSGVSYKIGVWAKLGTATNFCFVANNTAAWNTVGGKCFTSADGLTTSGWTYLSYVFTGPASTAINLHIGANSDNSAQQQTAGTVYLWNWEITKQNGGATISNFTGNVGIGTSAVPAVKLDVAITGATNLEIARFLQTNSTTNNQTYMLLGQGASTGRSGALMFVDNTDTTSGAIGLLNYGDSWGTGLVVKKGGNVGVGSASPANNFAVVGGTLTASSQATYAVGIRNGTGTDQDITFGSDGTYSYMQTWNSKILKINGQGNNVWFGGDVRPVSTNAVNLGASGQNWGCLYYNNSTLGSCASDVRLKQNISDLSFDQTGGYNALEQVSRLRMRTFSFKSDTANSMYDGMIAQETETVAPELVFTGPDGYKGIKYGDLQWITLQAVQQMSSVLNVSAAVGHATSSLTVLSNGFVGIGTTTPSSRFSVFSNVSGGGVASFTDLNGTCTIDPTSAALVCSSDQNLKKDIVGLDATTTLDKLMNINAVQYHWNREDSAVAPLHTGFIAQNVEAQFPEFVTTNPDGTKAVAYSNFIPVLVQTMQTLNNKVNAMDVRLAHIEELVATSTPTHTGLSFGDILSSLETAGLRIAGGVVYAKDLVVEKMTVGSSTKPAGITLYDEVTNAPYCLKMRNGAMVSIAGECTTGSQNNGSGNASSTDTTSPVISINGDNPATITVGTSYVDLGASVTDTDGEGNVNNNLGLHFSVDGTDVNEISLDTASTTTHTIVYSAVDGVGNWGFATRTVEVVAQ